jgi:superfamily II DNA or RNA helicase
MVCISKSLSLLKKGTPEYEDIANRDVIALDEAHLWASETLDSTCTGVLRGIPYRFFVTGTLERGDGTLKILQSIVGKTVMEMTTKEGISQGFLCPLEFRIIKTFSPVNVTYKDPGKMRRVHFLNNKNIAEEIAKICNREGENGRGTLVLIDELSQIPLLTKLLTVPYSIAHGNTTDKEDQEKYGIVKCDVKKSIEDFNTGKSLVLLGTSCVQTGCNIFSHVTCSWIGGSSIVEHKQGPIGRSVRVLETSKYAKDRPPKPKCVIYDFDVEEQSSGLKKRLSIYKETGCPIIK